MIARAAAVGCGVVVAAALLAGCVGQVAPVPSPTPPVPSPTGTSAATLRPRPTLTPATLVTTSGVGPARLGMSLAEGVAARLAVPVEPAPCVDLRTDAFLQAFPGVTLEWTTDGLRTVVVGSKDYVTEAGVRTGDSAAALRSAYGDRLRFVPRDLGHFENLGGRGGPLAERFGATIPAVAGEGGVLLFPLFEGRVDHIEVVPAGGDRLPTYAGECR